MDPAVQTYVDGIAADTRALFDRIHQLIVGKFADIDIGISYNMPLYRRANRSLNVGAWKHGVSIYGFPEDGALSILERHPELSSGKGTLRITHTVADDIRDEELIHLMRQCVGRRRCTPLRVSDLTGSLKVSVAQVLKPRPRSPGRAPHTPSGSAVEPSTVSILILESTTATWWLARSAHALNRRT